jgi:hypothetical protein
MQLVPRHYSVIALAGRRTDADDPNGAERFPVENVPLVRRRIQKLFEDVRPDVLVSSAAAGADLIAIETAEKMGIRRRIVLPVEERRFRDGSVLDRGEAWGELFDTAIITTGEIITMDRIESDLETYLIANERILDEAVQLAAGGSEPSDGLGLNVSPLKDVLAVIVWEGVSRGIDDVTGSFRDAAEARGIDVVSIDTLDREEQEIGSISSGR